MNIEGQYKEFFQKYLGFSPYRYQVEVAKHLLSGNNVILSAPTGAGKTLAALMPYLFSQEEGAPFADKILYALPLRSLATNLFQSSRSTMPNVTIQTGEYKDDPFWQGDICFTTIDQLLSGYLNIPLSLPNKLGNINAGALVGSLVIFDEIHLLDPKTSWKTVLEMASRLKETTRFLLMTATLTSDSLRVLADYFAAKLVTVSPEEIRAMPSHAQKKREYRKIESPLTAAAVLNCHKGNRTIVICNTVEKAQGIYKEISAQKPKNTTVLLLHSRFYQNDRKRIEEQIIEYLGPKAQKTDVILVATQVLEAGIDISADQLHTELAPANTIVQRAGRCARYQRRNEGQVYVYLPLDDEGKLKFLPYEEKELLDTWNALEQYSGACLAFQDEVDLINQVHGSETSILRKLIAETSAALPEQVEKTIEYNERSNADQLIRDIESVSVFICDQPENLDPMKLEYLSISPGLLKGTFQRVSAVGSQLFTPYEDEGSWRWAPVRTVEDLMGVWVVSIPTTVASYSSDLGLDLKAGGNREEIRIKNTPAFLPYGYEFETYREHALATYKELLVHLEHSTCAVRFLSSMLDVPEEVILIGAKLAALLHDCGKLTARWATAINNWQRDFYPEEIDSAEPIAHATYRPENNDFQRQKGKEYQRGGHSLEGAMAVCLSIYQLLNDLSAKGQTVMGLVKAVSSAIASHHTVLSGIQRQKEPENFAFIPEALRLINEVQKEAGLQPLESLFSLTNKADGEDFKEEQLIKVRRKKDRRFVPFYWFIVRLLRLSDQKATEKASSREGR